MRCAVLGAGSFGTALAVHLGRLGHEVRLWERQPERAAFLNARRRNPRYLSDVPIPDTVVATPELREAVDGAELVLPSVPSHAVRAVVGQLGPWLAEGARLCCASKGVEEGTLVTMSTVCEQAVEGRAPVTVLSGPSFAKELAGGLPTTVVVAGAPPVAREVAEALHGGALRVYHTDDVVGVCVGGSLKNVIAIATGIADGLGLGLNARAALITRGLAEITRLAVAMGADPLTLAGLAGMGDLVLTCTGDLSRNRRVGLALGQGRSLDDILEELGETAEGVRTARSARSLGQKLQVDLPITDVVDAMLYDGLPAREGLHRLMSRDRKHEKA